MRLLSYRANLPKSISGSLSSLSIRFCYADVKSKALTFLLTALTLLAALVFSSSHALAQQPPGSVSSVSLSRADGTVTATWPAVSGATKYHVTYSTDGGASWHAPVADHLNIPTNSLTFSADNAKTYIVGVRAGNDNGWGGWTNSPSAGPYTPPPAISATLTIADASAEEGDALSFTVTLDNAVPDGLTVTPSFTDGTATSGTDYTANTNALNFTGTAGETQTFTVSTTEDEDVEDNETFTVGLTVSGTTHDITASDTATGTITNDDTAPAPVPDPYLGLSSARVQEGDSGTTTMTFTARLTDANGQTQASTKTITAHYEVLSESGDTATAGQDYTATSGQITFAPGETSKTIDVSVIGDTEVEGDETLTVKWTGWENAYLVSYTHTGTITNDDSAPVISATVTIDDASADEGDSIFFTVTLDNAVPGGLTVTPSYTDGTATNGTDYTAKTNALNFTGTAGEKQTFTVSTTEDEDVEDNETFTIGLSVSGTTHDITATDTATGTINNDDSAPVISATVTIDDASADEGDALSFTVTLDNAVPGGLTVTPSFTDGTATDDYIANTNALNFTGTAGETQTFTVSTTEDEDVEDNETFTIGLSVSGTTHDITATDTATGTINNDDRAPENTVQPGVGPAVQPAVEEDIGLSYKIINEDGTSTQSIPIGDPTDTNKDGASTQSIGIGGPTSANLREGQSLELSVKNRHNYGSKLVAVSFPGAGRNPVSGADYTASPSGRVNVPAGQTKKWTFTAKTDDLVEHREDARLRVTYWTGSGRILGEITTGVIRILDGTKANVRIANASASEGDAITFTLTLDKDVAGGFKVKPKYTNGTAIGDTGADKDFSRNGKEIAFAGTAKETKTFTVSTKEDEIVEHDETFTVGLRVIGTSLSVNTATATGTITNDDYAKVAATHVAVKWIDEGDKETYTMKLDKAVQDSFKTTVRFTTDTNPGTAGFGTDYISYTSVLTFAGTAGETNTIEVSTIEDEDVELHEPFGFWLESDTAPKGVTLELVEPSVIRNDDHAILTVSDASADEGESMTFTITLDKAVPGGLTVTPTYTNGTTANSDYTKNLTALSFSGTAGETKTFTVSTTEDTEVEANENFIVGTAVSKTKLSVINTDTGTGTINDDESAAVTINDASANEGSAITFTVTLNKAVPGGLTVTPSYSNGVGTTKTDYTANTTAITFSGTTNETKTFTVQTTQDTTPEADETFTVSLTVSKTSHSVTATDTGTGTIKNDDIPRLTVSNQSANEGESMTFTVTLDRAVPGGLTVTPTYNYLNTDTATKGTDYTANTTRITFTGTANESKTFTVSTTEDTTPEANEIFRVGCIASKAYPFVTHSNMGTGTITDDDTGPKVTVSNASASEGDAISFTVTLDKAVSSGFTATPTYTNGTTASTDYTTNTTKLTFTGTANESKTFTVSTTEDEIVEHDETFTVDLTITDNASVVGTETGTGTINDDDSATLTISNASASEGGAMTFTVTLDKALSDPLTAEPSYFDKSPTATKGTDYTANTSLLTFSGTTANDSKTFNVQTTQDSDVESDETFSVGLSFTSLLSSKISISGLGTGTINNDDKANVTVSDASAEEGESMTFTMTLNNAVSSSFVLKPTYNNFFNTDTATKGTDYTANESLLTFTGTAKEAKTFTVSTTEDTDVESNETFRVGVTSPNTYDFGFYGHHGNGTITNDDYSASVTISNAFAEEGNSMTFNLALNNAVSGGFTVTPSYTNGTAASTDYTENTTAITFNGTKGETKTLTVQTTEDTTPEARETFTVNLAISNTSVSATDTGTGTITDDDDATLTVSHASAEEGESMTFTVTLTNAVQGDLIMQPHYFNLTASSNDYTENTTAITFTGTANESHTFTVQTTEDTDIEPDETFNVGMRPTSASSILNLRSTSTGTSTITNDDWNASVTIDDALRLEGESMTFTITLDNAVTNGFTVTPRYTNVTASDNDYTANTNAITFTGTASETKTFTVQTTADTTPEADETFTIGLTVSNTNFSVGATDRGTGTIGNDDDVILTVANQSAEEGESMTFTVTLTNAVQGLEVVPHYYHVTTSRNDYTQNESVMTFTGTVNESHTFTVQTTEDTDIEPDETFTIVMSPASTSSVRDIRVTGGGTVTGTITNDDTHAAALTINDASAAEGESMTFTVTLDNAITGAFTVTPSYTNRTASDNDYTKNTTALNFSGTAGESQTFTVQTTEDSDKEVNETFRVRLTSPVPSTTSIDLTDTGKGTIKNDDYSAKITISDASAAEGDSISFTLTLDKAVSGGFTGKPTYTAGTARVANGTGKDIKTPKPDITFAGTAGETKTFKVPTKEDDIVEHDETFTVGFWITDSDKRSKVEIDTGTGTINDDDTANVTITKNHVLYIDEGDQGTITATLDKAVQGGFTIPVNYKSGSTGIAQLGTDYSTNATTLTFAGTANEQKTITISTIEDTDVELHETLNFHLVSTNMPADVTLGTLTPSAIRNDDIPTLTVSDTSAVEGNSMTFKVTLDKAMPKEFKATPTYTNGTATEGTGTGDDYEENTTTLTFTGTAGESKTFTVSTTEDTTPEANETFTVDLTVDENGFNIAGQVVKDTGIGTITDDDRINLAVNDASVSEGGAITFTITLNQAVSGGFTATPTYTNGTGITSADYTANTDAITFTGTDKSKTFTVSTTEDTDVEADETFTVGLTVSNTTSTIHTQTGTGTINNDDSANVTIADASASEGDDITFTVTLDKAIPNGLKVTPNYTNGTATGGTDYTGSTTALTFTGTAGETKTFTVSTTEDTDVEANETFTVGLTVSGTTYDVIDTDTGTGTINNDDSNTVALSANPSSVAEGATATTVTVTASTSGGATFPDAKVITVAVGKTGDSATEGTDYTTVPNLTLTITAGQTSTTGTFTLTPTQDTYIEGNETITVEGSATGATVTGTSVTLTDDDSNTITLSADLASIAEYADAKNVQVTASLSAGVTFQEAKTINVTVGGNSNDTATKNTDYSVLNAKYNFTITIPAGKTSAYNYINQLSSPGDFTVEGDETFSVTGSATGATVTGFDITVIDKDTATVSLSVDPSTVSESASATTITVTASSRAKGNSISFATAQEITVAVGKTGDSATEGTDYTTVPNFTLTIAANQSTGTGTFTLTPTQDTSIEGSETITVEGSLTGTTVNGTSVALSDDDSNAISLSVSPSSISEGATATSVTVTASLSAGVTFPAAKTVTISVGKSGDTATEGTDYATVSNFTLTIAANQATGTATFSLSPIQDTVAEDSETLAVEGSATGTTVTGDSVTLTDDETAAISLSVNPSSVSEGEGATTVTVTAKTNGGITFLSDQTLSVKISGSTATEDTDYETVADLTITIAKGQTSGSTTFTLTPKNDKVVEGNETITLNGTLQSVSQQALGMVISQSLVSMASITPTITSASLALTDDDTAEISLSVNPSSVSESATATAVTVTASIKDGVTLLSDQSITVSVGKSGDSATEGTDYTTVSDLTLTITKGQSSGTTNFTLTPTNDVVAEGDETITVAGSTTGYTVGGTSVTLSDDDDAVLTINDAEADEGDDMTFTMTLDKAVQGGITVTPGYINGTGSGKASATDYTANTNTLTFTGTAGETKKFTVSTTEDAVMEADETFTVEVGLIASRALSSITSTDTGTGTIKNDDTAGILLAVNPSSVAESASATTITVTASTTLNRTFPEAKAITIDVGKSGDSATEGTDYATVSNFTITIAAGQTSKTGTFTLTPTQDTATEGDETITVAGSASNVTVTGTSVTLTDDDGATLTVNDASASEGESMTFTVTLNNAVSGGLTVTPSYTNGTAASSDYDENTTALTFTGTANETKTFTVSTTEDAILEANETFTIGLSVSNAPSGITSTDTGTGTINDDDSAAVTINDANADEGDSMTFTVTLDKAVQGGFTVTPSFTNGTGTTSADYEENTTALTFAGTAGETKTFTVSTSEDTNVETNETFTVGLTASNSSVTDTDTGTGTINNDDGTIITINDASASEGDDLTFTITLGGAVSGGFTVTPSYTNVTSADTDYTANTTAITFTGTANETKTFTVSTTEDYILEANETFTVSLTASDVPQGVTITATDTGTGTINNDDSAIVTIADTSSTEGANMTFTITLDKAVQGGFTVTPNYNNVSTEANNNAATSADYTQNTTAITFTGTANETKTFSVTTKQDAILEANEIFTVGLAVSKAPSGVTAPGTSTGTIKNDDSAAITINDASATEGSSMTFTVTLNKAVQGGLKVTPSYTNGTGTTTDDYDENTTALSFNGTVNETKTFTVATTQDAILEANETFTVGLTVSDAPSGITSTDTGIGIINNDDSAKVTINNASANEGDDITFTVTLDKAVQGGLTVTPSYTNGTAANSDYTKNTTALSFTGTANETKTFSVSTTEDAVLEANETFTVSLTASNSSVTATDTGTGTINNDDSAKVTINNASASEGDDITFTVTLDKAVQGGLTVTPSFTDGTAIEGTDYDENTTALNFTGTAGETETFTVSTDEDAVLEANETFTVGLTVSGTTLSITATDTGTGNINDDDGATVTINDASASEGSSMTFTVTLDKAVQGGLTVTPSYTNGTGTTTDDYDENTTALSFTGTTGETKTFSVSTTEDAILEANETFTVGLTASKSGITATDTGTGTINNDDSAAVTIDNASATEGSDITFTVTLDKAVQGGLKVTPSFTDGTATEGTDYDENTTALTFSGTAGETETITVSTTQDTDLESNETFTVGLSVSGTTLSITATDTGTGTINDNDGATITINDASATEGSGIEFTVTLDKAVTGGLKVTPSYTNGTAANSDYTKNTNALTFTGTANETKKFTVSTTNDAVLEANETFTVGLSVSGTTLSVTATDTGTGTINDNDNAAVTIENANADEGNDITFTVTLDKAVQGGLKVTPSFTDGTATEGTDYDENTTALTFSGTAGETETFTVSTTEDTHVEGAETFTVSLSVSGTTLSITATDTGTGTINDDDGATVTINDASASEGDNITFTVTLGQAVTGGLTVTPSYTNGTAASSDYTANTTAISFTGTKGETKTFTVSTTEDAVLEGNETFTISLTASNSGVTDTDTGTGTINNDDSAAVTINDANADEGSNITFTVTLDNAVQGGLTVTPSFTDGTATEGTDYDENTTTLNFTGTANEQKTFTVSTTQDVHVEGNETFTISLTASNSGVTDTDTGTGTINNNDGSATVTINDASASEGESMTFTITLNKAVSGGFTVTPSYTNGTAASTDYTANTNAISFTGTKDESKTFSVSTKEDAILEANETFTINLTAFNAGVTTTDTGTGTINNDDSAAVTINDASADEGDNMTFTVTLDKAVQGGLTVTPSYTNSTAANDDYTANTTALTFTGTADETKTFTVSTKEDAVLEGAETFTIGLTASKSGVTATDTGTGTINNDDSAAVTIADASASEGSTITFTVTLDKAVQGGLKVTPSFTDGTATEGTDYDENTATLTFTGTANESKTFTVSTTQDTHVEGNETFTVGLSVSGTTLSVTATDNATGTINDDDSAAVTINDASATEGDSMTFTVTLNKAVQGGLTVTPNYTNVTTEDADYTKNTTALTFTGTANETKTFSVSTKEDTHVEANETFTVGLTVSKSVVTATDTGTGTINDDEAKPYVIVNNASVQEGDSGTTALTFTARLTDENAKTKSSTETVTASYKVYSEPGNTATAGTDYTATNGTLTFAPGETSKTIDISVAGDTEVEGDETLTWKWTGWTNSLLAFYTYTGTINNDDSATVTINDANADEGDSMTFTVTLSEAVQGGLTVTPSYTNGTAASTDYTANTTALSFTGTKGETKTFTVSTTQDAVLEANETFTVALSTSNSSVTSTDTGTGTVNNDDVSRVTINDAYANEGDSMTFTVTLSNDVQGGLTVTPSFTDVTATKGTDYTENTTALSFTGTPNETKTFTVSTTADGVFEHTETFTVGLSVSNAPSGVVSTDTGTGTIYETSQFDDPAVTINDANASEGDSMTFTVTLDNDVLGGFTVTPSYTDGTATAGTDYTENTTTLTFTGDADETQTFTVSTTEDTDKEADETFTVSLSVSGTTYNVTAIDTGTGTINDDDTHNDDVRPTVALSGPTSVQKGAFDVTITFSESVTGFVQSDISVTNGSATAFSGSGANYTVTITPTATGTVTVNVGANVAQDESGNGNTAATPYSVQANLDAPTPAATVTVNDASASEGDSMTFTVTLDSAVQGGLTVTPSFTDGTATAGTDYTANTTALTFTGTANETKTFTVSTTEDGVVEGNETFTVSLTASNSGVTDTDTGTGTINNDDARPTVTLSGPTSVQKGAFDVTITFSTSVTGFVQSDLSVSNGSVTAFSGSAANYTATITPKASGTVTVDVAENVAQDGSGNGNTAAAPYSVQTDLDAPTISISGPQSLTDLNAFDVTITFSESVFGFVQSDISVTNGSATAFSGSGASYTATITPKASGTITVDVGADVAQDGAGNGNQKATPFSVQINSTPVVTPPPDEDPTPPLEDPTSPPKEDPTPPVEDPTSPPGGNPTSSVQDSTSTTEGNATLSQDSTSTTEGNATVTINDASAVEGQNITFTITLDNAIAGGFTVTPKFIDETAQAGTDYTPNTAPLTFTGTKGETQTFAVATIGDGAVESHETFTVGMRVSNTSQNAHVTATDTGTGTINDNDVYPTVTISGPSDVQIGAFDITITFSESMVGFVQSDIVAGNGSVTAFSGSGASYTATIIPTASGTVTVDVPKNVAEDYAGNGNTAAAQFSVKTDLDPPSVVISVPSYVQTGAFDITITFSETVVGFVQSDIVVGNAAVTAFSGSGADYTATITPTASGTITVDVPKNVAKDYAGNGNTAAAQLSVVADLRAPTPDITAAPNSGLITAENGKTARFTVTLDTQPASAVTLAIKSSDITEGTVASKSITFTTENWNTPQTITITGQDDDIDDGDQDYHIVLTPTSDDSDYAGLDPLNVPVTNRNDDTAGITIAYMSGLVRHPQGTVSLKSASGVALEPPSQLITSEAGHTVSFSVVLDSQPTAAVTLDISSSDLTEGLVSPESLVFIHWDPDRHVTDENGRKFTTKRSAFDFNATNWNIPQMVTVTGLPDNLNDNMQSYTVTIAPISGTDRRYNELGPKQVSLVNLDNAALSDLTLSKGTLTPTFASETTAYTAWVENAVENLTVTPTASDSTATITVNGIPVQSGTPSGAIALDIGANTIEIIVTNTVYTVVSTKTYTVTVFRKGDNVMLSDLTLSQGTLTPTFASETTAYTAWVENTVESLTVTPTASAPVAMITVNGIPVQSGTPSDEIALDIGPNVIETIIIDTGLIYTVTVTRGENNAPDAPVLQNQTAIVGEAFHYAFAEVNDPDPGQTITYTATLQGDGSLPAWLHFDAENRTFSGTPDRTDVGSVSIAVTATDNGIPPMATTATFTLTVEPPDADPQVLKLALASFGRTVASNAVDVLESRFTSPRADGVMLGGQALNAREDGNRIFGLLYGIAQSAGLSINLPMSHDPFNAAGNMAAPGMLGSLPNPDTHEYNPIRFHRRSMRDILSQSSFDMRLGQNDAEQPSPWAVWGQGNASGFSGSEDHVSLNGRVFSAFLGVDHHLKNNMTLGLALSHSTGEIDYTGADGDAGTIDLSLNSLIPYAHYATDTGMDIWGMGSAGWGETTVTDTFSEEQTDIAMQMGALGMQNPVAQMGDVALSLKGDAFIVGIGSDVREKLPLTEVGVQRVRFALQGETNRAMSETSVLTPRLELGGRWDGGSADTGVGAEIGGGLTYLHTPSGWGIEARGRYLFAHQDADFEDWGASLNLRFDPGSRSRGLWLAVSPKWGQPDSRANALWDNAQMLNTAMGNSGGGVGLQPHHLDMEIGYGLPVSTGLFTSYSGMSTSIGAMHYRLGSRLEIGQFLHINLEGEYRDQTAGASATRLMLQGYFVW